MTTPKEITATEKLLDLIRASSSTADPEPAAPQALADNAYSGLRLEKIDQDPLVPEPIDSPTHRPRQVHVLTPQTAPLPSNPKFPSEDQNVCKTVGFEFPAPTLERSEPPSYGQAAVTAINRALQGLRPLAKTIIAIDIQPGMIYLVKARTSKQGQTLQACQSVPYQIDPHVNKPRNLYDDTQFKAVLFSALSSLVDRHGRHEIWCSYFFCNPVAVHNISIPKVGDREVANAVFWSAKRELEFDETALLFDYAILQETTEGALNKIQSLVTLVPRPEVQGVEAMFRNAGFPLTGLTFPAAAIQNFLNRDQSIPVDRPVVYFTIRKHNSFIDLYYQGKMFFSREIKTGIDSFIESLYEQASSQNILIDDESAKEYLFPSKVRTGDSSQGQDGLLAEIHLDQLAVIDRLVRQLTRTFEYCNSTFKTPPVSEIFTSGEYTVSEAILKAIESRVDIKCTVLDPLSLKIFHHGLEPPPANGSGLLVAAGLSLSDKQTTANFLFTYAERLAEAATNRINTVIALATICLTIGCGAFFAWQYNQGLDKKASIHSLRTELDRRYQAEPRSRTGDYANQSIQKISQFHRDNKEKAKRFKAIAMISELTKGAAQEITITDLSLDLTPKETESRLQPAAPKPGSVQLGGYINAPSATQELILMNFLKTLASLNLTGAPDLKSKEKTSVQGQDVLRFEVRLKTTLEFLEPPRS